ncbi:MAG: FHA domain-containing protein [Deltaproteobacteria bacterium]|nr:FHA domain-containing protein [Deltaproteobacteria bacterium]
MSTLTLKFKDNVISEYPVKKGETITIGRLSDNHVVIENLAVSGHHAKVDSVGNGFLLTDLQSKNGTFVNQKMITTHWLKHGDVVTVGKHHLVFTNEEEAEQQGRSDLDQTMVMDTAAHRALMSQTGKNDTGTYETSVRGGDDKCAKLTFLTGGEGEVEIKKSLTTIGKKPTSDVVVSGFLVAKLAATISRRPNGYYLGYVGGSAKPKVNNEVVKQTVKLKDMDLIEIGSVKLQFNESK